MSVWWAELLRCAPSERLAAAAVLHHPYLGRFVRDDPTRHAYAAASLAAPVAPFVPPLDDGVRLGAREYRAYLERHLATALVDPIAPAVVRDAHEDDMGA